MGANVGGSNKFVSDINVTPFVDVMLVLLIIFMVATPMMSQGLDVDLRDLAALDRMQPAGRRGKTAKGAQDSDGIEITSVEDIRF